MNIDLHSHFFPIEALQNPGKYQDKAPKIVLDKGRLTVTSGGGMRGNLAPSAHDAAARIHWEGMQFRRDIAAAAATAPGAGSAPRR